MLSTERSATEAPARSAGSVAEVLARTEALIPGLRQRADAVDELRQMLPASVAELKSAGTARLYQPARFGGCEADMRSGVEALAAVGRGCGSSAWCFVQHLTHNFMLSQWPDRGQHDIWDEDPACLVSGIFISGAGRARSPAHGAGFTRERTPSKTRKQIYLSRACLNFRTVPGFAMKILDIVLSRQFQ